MNKEVKQEGKTIFKGKVLTLEHDLVKCPNGKLAYREIIRHHGGAAVLLIQNDEVFLIKQFRYAYQENILEIPAGKLEASEDPKSAALRELEEETGYHTDALEYLGVIYPTVGYTDEKIYLYLAKEATPGETHMDEDECISGAFYPMKQVINWILDGTIKDAKTICAIEYYLLKKAA